MSISLPFSYKMCFGCSKDPSYRDGSFECQQHMFASKLRNIIFKYALLSGGLDAGFSFEYLNKSCHKDAFAIQVQTIFSAILFRYMCNA